MSVFNPHLKHPGPTLWLTGKFTLAVMFIMAMLSTTATAVDSTPTSAQCSALLSQTSHLQEPAWAQSCYAKGKVPASTTNRRYSLRAPTDTAYALDIGFVSDNFVSHALDDFPGQTTIGSNNRPIFAMDFDPTGTTLYAVNHNNGRLGTIDLATGGFSPSVSVTGIINGHTLTGMTIAHDGTTYLSATTCSNSSFYTLDLATGVATLIGSDSGQDCAIDIAVDCKGNLYTHDIISDGIFRIDASTGKGTRIGNTGINAGFAQGMDFDNKDGTLYMWGYIGGGESRYGTVDLDTGRLSGRPKITSRFLLV